MLINLLPHPVVLAVDGREPLIVPPSGVVMHAEFEYVADTYEPVDGEGEPAFVPIWRTHGNLWVVEGDEPTRIVDFGAVLERLAGGPWPLDDPAWPYGEARFIVARAVSEMTQNGTFLYPHDIQYDDHGRAAFARALAYVYH